MSSRAVNELSYDLVPRFALEASREGKFFISDHKLAMLSAVKSEQSAAALAELYRKHPQYRFYIDQKPVKIGVVIRWRKMK